MLNTALIVDDSRLARLTLKRLLVKYDIEVYEAEGVVDAERWITHNILPDLIFMDVMMPEIDGFEGLARLRAEHDTKNTPIIMYSGDISEEARKKARDNGATGYLPKPADANRLDHLLNALNKRLKTAVQTPASEEVRPAIAALAEAAGSVKSDAPEPVRLGSTLSAQRSEPVQIPGEIKRRLDELERRVSAQDMSTAGLEVNADIERQRRDVVYLQRQVAKSEQQVKIALGIGVAALMIALAAVIRMLI